MRARRASKGIQPPSAAPLGNALRGVPRTALARRAAGPWKSSPDTGPAQLHSIRGSRIIDIAANRRKIIAPASGLQGTCFLRRHKSMKAMPRRSDIYQRLVLEIHRQLGRGWTVSESCELREIVSGKRREVDIVAQTTVGGYTLVMCIEVRDRKRPADVTWVERLASTHNDLPTDKLVLWSSSGFSKNALEKAKARGIDLVTPLSGDKAPWARITQQLLAFDKVKFVRTPKVAAFVDVDLQDGRSERWDAKPQMRLRELRGVREAEVGTILKEITSTREHRTVLLDHAPEGAGSFHVIYTPPFPCAVQGPSGELGTVRRLIVDLKSECELASVATRSAIHEATATTLAEANLSCGVLRLVARERQAGNASIQ